MVVKVLINPADCVAVAVGVGGEVVVGRAVAEPVGGEEGVAVGEELRVRVGVRDRERVEVVEAVKVGR